MKGSCEVEGEEIFMLKNTVTGRESLQLNSSTQSGLMLDELEVGTPKCWQESHRFECCP